MPVYIELYKAKWCGHCHEFEPTWEALKEYAKTDKKYSDYIFNSYDSDDDADIIKDKERRGLKLDGYPTIIVAKDNRSAEFSGHKSVKNILEFVDKFVNQKGGSSLRGVSDNIIKCSGFTYYSNPMNGGARLKKHSRRESKEPF
jgi:thioredoxin-like negative regulator of GroEL